MFIKKVGYATESEQTKYIKNGVFIVSFFNTAILLLIVNADLNYSGIPLIGKILNGRHTDFSPDWYNEIGNNIVSAMISVAMWPIIEFFGFYGMRFTFRLLDRGICSCDTYKTKKRTIQQYIDVYSGPEYMIHYKYSSIMMQTYVAFMYGAGIPILFPIALMGMFILYCVERLCVAFSYKQPPVFDEKLNKSTINILRGAPFLYVLFGFWMYGN